MDADVSTKQQHIVEGHLMSVVFSLSNLVSHPMQALYGMRGNRQQDVVQDVVGSPSGAGPPLLQMYDVPRRVIEAVQRIGEPCCVLFSP